MSAINPGSSGPPAAPAVPAATTEPEPTATEPLPGAEAQPDAGHADRTTGSTGRAAVIAGLASGSEAAAETLVTELPGGILMQPGGSLTSASGAGHPLDAVIALAAEPAPFAELKDAALLQQAAAKLAELHAGLLGPVPGAVRQTQWSDARAAALELLFELTAQSRTLDAPDTARAIGRGAVDAADSESTGPARDAAIARLRAGVEQGRLAPLHTLYPRQVGVAGGLEPIPPAGPAFALDTEPLGRAVTALANVAEYHGVLTPEVSGLELAGATEPLTATGLFDGVGDDGAAFRISRGEEGALQVALSSHFAHADNETLTRMLAVELGSFLADEAGLGHTDHTALGAALLERVVHHQDYWHEVRGPTTLPTVRDQLVAKRYGLEGLDLPGLRRQLAGVDRHTVPPYGKAHFDAIRESAGALEPGPLVAAGRPRAVGEALTMPTDVQPTLGDPQSLDPPTAEMIKDLAKQLGLEVEVQTIAPQYIIEEQPATVLARVKQGDGERWLSIGLDSERAVRSAALLDLDGAAAKDQTLGSALAAFGREAEPDNPEAALRDFFDRRAAGDPVEQAWSEALAALALRASPGAIAPTSAISDLWLAGLISDEEFGVLSEPVDSLTDWQKPEKRLFDWVRAAARQAGLVPAELETLYRSERGPGTAEGRAAGLEAVLNALPDGVGAAGILPADADGWAWSPAQWLYPSLASRASSSNRFVPEGRLSQLTALFQQKLGVNRGDMAAAALRAAINPTPHGPQTAAAREAMTELAAAVSGGADLGEALVRALELYEQGSGLPRHELFGGSATRISSKLVSYGVVEYASPEAGAVTERLKPWLAAAPAPAIDTAVTGETVDPHAVTFEAPTGGQIPAVGAARMLYEGAGGIGGQDLEFAALEEHVGGGAEVTVAIIDDGVDLDHELFADNLATPTDLPGDGVDQDGNALIDDAHGFDFVDERAAGALEDDADSNHGTHVAGIASYGTDRIKLRAIRAAERDRGRDAHVRAIERAIHHARETGARVVNMSLSMSGAEHIEMVRTAIEHNPDLLFITAAGNSPQDIDSRPRYPASAPDDQVLTVASVTRDRDLYAGEAGGSGGSGFGAESVDLGAVGREVRSAWPYAAGDEPQYSTQSGTSMAAPFVANVAAKLMSLCPSLTAQDAKALILNTVDPEPGLDGRVKTGGVINSIRAYRAAALVRKLEQGGTLDFELSALPGGVDDAERDKLTGVVEALLTQRRKNRP